MDLLIGASAYFFLCWVCWWGTLTEVWGQTEVMKKWMGWGVGARELENLRKKKRLKDCCLNGFDVCLWVQPQRWGSLCDCHRWSAFIKVSKELFLRSWKFTIKTELTHCLLISLSGQKHYKSGWKSFRLKDTGQYWSSFISILLRQKLYVIV